MELFFFQSENAYELYILEGRDRGVLNAPSYQLRGGRGRSHESHQAGMPGLRTEIKAGVLQIRSKSAKERTGPRPCVS